MIYCLFSGVLSAFADQPTTTTHHVLVLNSYHQGFKWSDEIIEGLRQPLLAAFENVNIHIEHLDSKRYPDQDLDRLAKTFADKYKKLPLDVIITADDSAFNFIKTYRSRICNKTPLVFCGVNFLSKAKLLGLENYTGINETVDHRANIDLILELHPKAKRIVAISDLTLSGKINRTRINSFEPFYFTQVKFDHWYDLSHAELMQRLASLAAADVVLFTSFFCDRLGKTFKFDKIAREISRTSPVPVYGGWDYDLGSGIVGGKLASGYYQGSAAGEYAVRIINGEPTTALPLQWQSPNHYMFDETALSRFKINRSDLPVDSIIINHVQNPFEEYRALIFFVATVVMILLASTIYLAINTRRRIHAEKQLQESEAHYRGLTEMLPQTIFETDEQGQLNYTNQFGLDWSGYSHDDLHDRLSVLDIFHPDDHNRLQKNIARTHDENSSQGNEYRFIKKDGSVVPVLVYSRSSKLTTGGSGLRGSLIDISDIRRAEQDALLVRLYLQNVVNLMPSILIGTDGLGYVSLWNNQAAKTTGITSEEAHGKLLAELLPALAGEQEKVVQALAHQQTLSEKRAPRDLSGEERFWDILVYPLSLKAMDSAILHLDDVTEQIQIEQVMVQTEKMMTIGGLAAGMAHEINNPLAAIIQTVQVALRRMSPDLPANIQAAELVGLPFENIAEYLEQRKIPAMLETVLKSGSRAADIIQDMLRFSRRENTEKRSIDIHELVDLAIKFAEKEHSSYDFKQIDVRKIYGELPPVNCSATQIQQVLLNIIKNGAEAMADWQQMNQPQKLTIHTQTSGESVRIIIEDNGPGMPETVRKRIFEPFYTTKAEGVGTGLGLSISYFIITQNHQGAIDVTSAPSKGTRFTIDLPIHPT